MTTPLKTARKDIRLDCGRYFLRTVTADDASERWGQWMADAEATRMLNAPARTLSKAEIATYIASFDQKTHVLLGIFETASDKLLGFLRVDIDPKLDRCLVSMLIGEPDYRHKGVTNEITVPFRDYFFETVGLDTMLATALSHNTPIIYYLKKTGWVLDKTIDRHVKSQTGEDMLGMCFFRLTREAWRAWKKQNVVPDA